MTYLHNKYWWQTPNETHVKPYKGDHLKAAQIKTGIKDVVVLDREVVLEIIEYLEERIEHVWRCKYLEKLIDKLKEKVK